jgi:hypothetical protein
LEVIGTTKINSEIDNILDGAEKYLVLVSPYLKISKRLKVRLTDTLSKVDKAHIIYRENSLSKEEYSWLNSFSDLKLTPINNLHAKIYFNERTMLISSMNLYEYSQINNHEIGVLLDRHEDEFDFIDVVKEVRVIVESEGKGHFLFEILESLGVYTMRNLFWSLIDEDSVDVFNFNEKELYIFICNEARKRVKFTDRELYKDKTAILRATNLGKKRYEYLQKELSKLRL